MSKRKRREKSEINTLARSVEVLKMLRDIICSIMRFLERQIQITSSHFAIDVTELFIMD